MNLDPLANEILERLRNDAVASSIVLGGGVAMQHYLEFRPTHDIDAWWSQEATREARTESLERLRVIAMSVASDRSLEIRERGSKSTDMVSIEFQKNGVQIFSMQIATRDIELAPPIVGESPWYPVAIEAFVDNLASKMSALANRGAPRDFQDVFAVTGAGLVSVQELWDLWQRKHPGEDLEIAKASVAQSIEELELRRPIERVPAADRERAIAVRSWVRNELTAAPALRNEPASIDRTPEPERELDRGRLGLEIEGP